MAARRLIYQDVLDQHDPEEAFFELANADLIGYRLSSGAIVEIAQDATSCGQHTGGIVWETSYLLLEYLKAQRRPLGYLLEVGAGCGLLGQALAYEDRCTLAVLTECERVLGNLRANLERNRALGHERSVRPCQLDWIDYRQDMEAGQIAPADTIVGTDVVFCPALVEPLLQTLQALAHAETIIYLCVQIRCATSHERLLAKAPDYGFVVEDLAHEFGAIPACQFGVDLECHLLQLRRRDT